MKKLITILALAGGPLLMTAPDAQAHDRHAKYQHYDQARHRGHMPRWLRKDRDFQNWYRFSVLRGNLRYGWDDLFSIYRWEIRYSNHRRAHRYDRGYDRDFRYYRRYWNDQRRDRERYGDRKRYQHNVYKNKGHKNKPYGKKSDKRRHH